MNDNPLALFTECYRSGHVPWDTGITPPEIVQIVAELPPGRALDIGCGTGTTLRYLVDQGWEADGVDFVEQAIDRAREKLAPFPPERWRALVCDITRFDACAGLRPPYDLAIDIGCGHGLYGEQRIQYARDVAARVRPGGTFMLYAHQRHSEIDFGWMPDEVSALFAGLFSITWQQISIDTASGLPSAWYRLARLA